MIKKNLLHCLIFAFPFYTFGCDCALDLDALLDPCAIDIPEPVDPLPGTGCMDAEAILQIITPEPGQICSAESDVCPPAGCIINVPAILQEDLYKSTTSPITNRPLVDLPPLLRFYCLDNCPMSFTVEPFYNYGPKMVFAKNSPFIKCYIDLSNQNILQEFENALTLACADGIDIPGIIGLFSNIKLQQHRAGLMLGLCKTFDCLSLSFRIPVYYMVNHFFISEEEIKRIENASIFDQFGANADTPKERVEQFVLQHLVADRLGFGDSRLNALYKFYDKNRARVWLGLQMTFPTAQTWSKGIIGGTFSPCADIPDLNIKQIAELLTCNTSDATAYREQVRRVFEITTNFGIGVLDRLSTILINSPLGNGNHFGVGPQMDIRMDLNQRWSAHTFAAFEGFTRHHEYRFFLKRKDPLDFQRNFRDPLRAEENLTFLNNQFINTFFPQPIKLSIRPGYIGKAAQSLIYDSSSWHGYAGFDYWYQSPETVWVSPEITKNFNIDKALRPAAHQGKIFGGFGYKGITHCYGVLWDAAFGFDASIFDKNIGKTYTIAVRIGLNF